MLNCHPSVYKLMRIELYGDRKKYEDSVFFATSSTNKCILRVIAMEKDGKILVHDYFLLCNAEWIPL